MGLVQSALMIVPMLIGVAVVIFVMRTWFELDTRMWARLARAMPPPERLEWSQWKLIVWAAVSNRPTSTWLGRNERVYGTTQCHVCEDGLLFSQQANWAYPYCEPFYLSFEGMRVVPTDWLSGWASSYAIDHEDAFGLFLILDDKAVGWIAEQSRSFERLKAVGELQQGIPGEVQAGVVG